MEEMREAHPSFLQTTIPFSAEIEKMGTRRQPVLAYAPRRSAVQAYRDLCEEILTKVV